MGIAALPPGQQDFLGTTAGRIMMKQRADEVGHATSRERADASVYFDPSRIIRLLAAAAEARAGYLMWPLLLFI
jgi:hypothetical protein